MAHYDLAIIGGGLVGSSLARALMGTSLKVVVIDRAPIENLYSAALDNRGLALSYISTEHLERIGVWGRIKDKAYPIESVHVSEQGHFGHTQLLAQRLQVPALGYVVSASILGSAIMKDIPNITQMREVLIKSICYDDTQRMWNVSFEKEAITADLLVGADGTDSFVRQHLDIGVQTIDQGQAAIVTNLYGDNLTTSVAFERFTKDGILAILPFGEKRCKCVWTVEKEHLDKYISCSDEDFVQMVQEAFGFRLGRIERASRRKMFPIKQVIAKNITGERYVLLGNAANTLHPVAAQGFNLGLRDVVTLSTLLENNSLDEAIDMYAQYRRCDQDRTIKYTDILVDNSVRGKFLRRVGMIGSSLIPGLNRQLSVTGMGSWT